MAIYHCSVKLISRSKGRSATGAAAYRAGARIDDRRTGLSHDYTKKQGVSHCEILAPAGAPAWAYDRAELWNRVEEIEKRKDSQLAREVEIALPQELDIEQQKALATAYVREQFVQSGMVADICIHHADQENPHAHVMLTMRDIDQAGFGKKRRDWNDKALLEQWRAAWSQHANTALEQAGAAARIDHRSLEAQGVGRVATIKMGQAACAMERRGITTERGDINRSTRAANDEYQAALAELDHYRKQASQPDPDSDLDLESARFREARGFSQEQLRALIREAQDNRPREINELASHSTSVIDARLTIRERRHDYEQAHQARLFAEQSLAGHERDLQKWREQHRLRHKLHVNGWKKSSTQIELEQTVGAAREELEQAEQQEMAARRAVKMAEEEHQYVQIDARSDAERLYQQQPERAYEQHLRTLYRQRNEHEPKAPAPVHQRTTVADAPEASEPREKPSDLAQKIARHIYQYAHPQNYKHVQNASMSDHSRRIYDEMHRYWFEGKSAAQGHTEALAEIFNHDPVSRQELMNAARKVQAISKSERQENAAQNVESPRPADQKQAQPKRRGPRMR